MCVVDFPQDCLVIARARAWGQANGRLRVAHLKLMAEIHFVSQQCYRYARCFEGCWVGLHALEYFPPTEDDGDQNHFVQSALSLRSRVKHQNRAVQINLDHDACAASYNC